MIHNKIPLKYLSFDFWNIFQQSYQITWRRTRKPAGTIKSSDPRDHLRLKTMTPGIVEDYFVICIFRKNWFFWMFGVFYLGIHILPEKRKKMIFSGLLSIAKKLWDGVWFWLFNAGFIGIHQFHLIHSFPFLKAHK